MMNKVLLLVALLACATSASICHSWGDPHNKMLNGKHFDFYNYQGDFTFFRYGSDLVVQERISFSKSWGRNSLLVGVAVRFGRTVFEIQNDETRLNGKVVDANALKTVGIKVEGNVYTITSKKVTIKVHNHKNSDSIAGKNYLSLYVEVPPSLQKTDLVRMRGLCVEQDIPRYALRKRSLFTTKAVRVELPPRPPRRFTKEQRAAARKACKSTGLRSRRSIRDCVFDYLRAKNKEEVLRAYRGDAKDNKNLRDRERRFERRVKRNSKKCKRRLAACNKSHKKHKATISRLNTRATDLKRRKEAAEKQTRDAKNALNRLRSQFNKKYSALRNKYNRGVKAYRAVRTKACKLTKAYNARTARFKQIAALLSAEARAFVTAKRYRGSCTRRGSRRGPRRGSRRGPRRIPRRGRLIGKTVMLESLNYPGHFLRHRNFASFIDRPNSIPNDRLYNKDRRFIVRRGLAGKGISFESVNYPGYFLRHANFRVVLNKRENSDLYRKDASFVLKKSLAGRKGFYSFESVNYPTFFVRHAGYAGFINKNNNSKLFKEDASFRIIVTK